MVDVIRDSVLQILDDDRALHESPLQIEVRQVPTAQVIAATGGRENAESTELQEPRAASGLRKVPTSGVLRLVPVRYLLS